MPYLKIATCFDSSCKFPEQYMTHPEDLELDFKSSKLKSLIDVASLLCQMPDPTPEENEERVSVETLESDEEESIEEEFECLWENCGNTYKDINELVQHLSDDHVGSGFSKYSCKWDKCKRKNMPFRKRHKLWTHLRLHTGERPYKCTHKGCTKSFPRMDSLKLHAQTHLDERPYKCTFCHRRYYHLRSLKKHVLQHVDRNDISRQDAQCLLEAMARDVEELLDL
jgi:hypothetical protein